jgi:hypothetical protein
VRHPPDFLGLEIVMPDFRNVKYPTRLKAQPLADTDAPTLPIGTGQTAVGMGGEGEPSQLDIVYSADGRTLVYPANPPKGIQPWAFKGAVKSEDCVTWCRASLKASTSA